MTRVARPVTRAGASTVALGLAALAALAMPFVGSTASYALYYVCATVAVVVAVRAARTGPRPRRATAGLLAGAIVLFTLGDASWDVIARVMDHPPYPSVSDVAYLAAYPLLAAALLRMAGRGVHRATAVLDGLLAAVGTGLAAWVFVVGPAVHRSDDLGVLGRLLTLAYPAADVLLVVLALGIATRTRARHLVGLVLLATAAEVVADTAFMFDTDGTGSLNRLMSVCFVLGVLGWASCATALPVDEPGVPARGEGTPTPWTSIVQLAVALLAPPATLLVQLVRGEDTPVVAVAVGSALLWVLALARAVLVRRRLVQDRRLLGESEAHYLALAARASDLAARHAPDGTVLVVSEGGGRLLGVPDEALVGSRLDARAHPDDLAAVAAALDVARAGGQVPPVRHRLRRAGGDWAWVETTWFAVHDEHGHVRELRSATSDIGSRKALEDQLAGVLEASIDVLLVVGADTQVRWANEAVRATLGRSPAEVVGTSVLDLLGVARGDERLHELSRVTDGHSVTLASIFPVPCGDGRTASIEVAASWSGALGAAVVALRDVSHRVAAEDEARRSRAELLALVDHSPDAIERYGVDLLRTFANPSAMRRFGRDGDPAGVDHTPWSRAIMEQALGTRDQQRAQVVDTAGAAWEALFVPELDADGGVLALLVIARDVTDRVRAEEAVAHAATHDELTGLPNRRLLLDRLDHALALAARDGSTVAVLFLDLDRFKTVNDTLGHQFGDELLVSAARRLAGVCRPGDTVARLGGDEFVVLAERLAGVDDAGELANRLVRAFEVPFGDLERPVVLTTSIGVASTTGATVTAGELLRDADAAMYEAKRQGRNRHAAFDTDLRARVDRRVSVEAGVRGALARDELRLWYQPVVSLADGAVQRVEALLRWAHPEHGLVGPGDFMDVVVEAGLAGELTQWVLDRALGDAAEHGLAVSVNLSAHELTATLPLAVASALARHHADPASLWVEVPEHALVEQAVDVLRGVRALGVCVALDDFGAGYGSLARLATAPIDEIKLDRALTWTAPEDPQAAAVVASVVDLGRRLGVAVVGEGIETGGQLRTLTELGGTAVQGFLVAPPVPLEQLEATVQGCRRRLARRQDQRLHAAAPRPA